jgi:hypothetical protein
LQSNIIAYYITLCKLISLIVLVAFGGASVWEQWLSGSWNNPDNFPENPWLIFIEAGVVRKPYKKGEA